MQTATSYAVRSGLSSAARIVRLSCWSITDQPGDAIEIGIQAGKLGVAAVAYHGHNERIAREQPVLPGEIDCLRNQLKNNRQDDHPREMDFIHRLAWEQYLLNHVWMPAEPVRDTLSRPAEAVACLQGHDAVDGVAQAVR